MRKVCLINPPQLTSLDDRLDPPLGLLYIAASLENNGIDVSISDLASKSPEEWPEAIDDADIYGMTIFSASLNTARKIAKAIKERDKKAVIVAGGPHPTSLPKETLAYPEFDHVLKGEGEHAFLDFINNGGAQNNGVIIADRIKNLDDLPLPARHLVDMDSYTREVEGGRAASLITARGCPYSCGFCCKDVHGTKVRFRSVGSVIEEIEEMQRKNEIKSFIFYDDIFTLNSKRLAKFCDAFKDMNMTFRCNGHSGTNTYEEYVALREAGCKEIAFGIESGSQTILDAMNKRTRVEQNMETILTAKRAGLLTKAYVVSGFPGETQKTIDETKRFMEKADPDKFTVFQFVPLPGCDVWDNPEKYGVTEMSNEWDEFYNISGDYEGGAAFATKDLSAERSKELHDDLVRHLLDRGQRGQLQGYYEKLKSPASSE
jgi:anaerobic magnesium-protoporphyrin IX monomethyl ester cyclase